MYIVKNALANLHRNAGRNVIMVLIMIVLIASVSVSIIINTSAEQMIAKYKQQLGTEAVIIRDDDKLPQDFSQFIVPNKELLDKLAASPLLQGSTKTMSAAVILDDLKTINEGNIPSGKDGSGIQSDNNGTVQKKDPNYKSPNAMVFATTNPDISNEFKQGIRKIVEGTMYKNKDEAIISKQLADANHLSVGDTLVLKAYSMNPSADTSAMQKLTISGIYEDHAQENDESFLIALTTRANEIFISYSSTESSPVLADEMAQYDVRFTLKDPADLTALNQEFHSLGLPEYYRVTTDDSSYKKIVGPVEGMANITRTFTIGILVLGVILITVLSALAIRERKYEVGVLRAIGMKKCQVITGFILESMIMTGLSLILALGSAALINEPVASTILEVQKSSVKEENNAFIESGLQTTNTDINEIDTVPTSFSTEAVIQIIWISLLLALIASASSVIYITRYEPMKILSERN